MSLEEYALNLLLVTLVIRQLRGRRLTLVGLAWPLGLVAWAAWTYLRGIPTDGNDLALTITGVLTGALLGVGCGLLTRVTRRADGQLVAKATGLAALLWVLGVGSRLGFALYAEHGGEPVIARFSAAHHITTAAAWTACLVLMSLTEVVGRTATLGIRARRVPTSTGSQAGPAAAR